MSDAKKPSTLLADLVALAGLVAVAVGAGMVYLPAGVMVGGALLFLLGLHGGRR